MLKRLLVLFLSFGTIIAFGYALGGLGGYAFGRGKPLVIIVGLAAGILSGFLAMRIWKTYLDDIHAENPRDAQNNDAPSEVASEHHETK